MTITYVVFAGSVILFGGSAALALIWAVRAGQFENLGRGASSIFDADEPVGRPTDLTFARKEDRR